MEATAKAKYLRSSTNRMRQVADMIRGKSVETASAILFGLGPRKKSARMVEKVLKSALANWQVKQGSGTRGGNLRVKSVTVDAGPLVKRIRPRAQGRAFRIEKKLSHLTVVVSD
ncbi:MAG TPA: 50S ribosomal protein L22 [Fibrobacteres bacterium]|jgi:large subunit ribosomal protein L22|nr:50S ribosomal protein L22 [Fibrobacterota bacterium]